ncbi:putative bifunctional diguanylate cyclase/phosphodiesterase [Roseateles oligotrophus]|uniref:EAL domain-containing protein n=1 Tax=Roseateles oligotrophus TaxID=1769250 RepID=A0ABT2YE60_9BURK|nr:EAL domain-containing protein [Roseateles oligotrophus]MCV2368340.1 EAL domain-containing protein [Roseateles oligotrophus]
MASLTETSTNQSAPARARRKRLTLRQRVTVGATGLALLAALMLLLASSAFDRMKRAQAHSDSAHHLTLEGQRLLRMGGELLLSQGSKSSRDGLRSSVESLSGHLEALAPDDPVLAEAALKWPPLRARVEQLLALRWIDVHDDDTLIAYGRLVQGMERLKPILQSAQDQAERTASAELQTGELWLMGGLLGLTTLAALGGVTLVRLLDHQLGGDPGLARRIAGAIANGELDTPVPVSPEHPKSVLAALEHVRQRLLDRRTIEAQVQYLARHDSLSGALNRASFNELLNVAFAQARRGKQGLAVMYIDLDHFKAVNDTLGHAHGDEVIRITAKRLRELLRLGDHLARLGGDEFAIIVQQIARPQDFDVLAQRIIDSLTQPVLLGAHAARVGASIGIAQYGADIADCEELMHKADLAMYRAKTKGRGCWSLYDEQLDDKLKDQRELMNELRTAIGSEQLSLYYQPIFASDGLRLLGHEALLRWAHPSRGMVKPTDFTGPADTAGLMQALGEWVLQKACSDAMQWPSPLAVSVNLAASQLRQDKLVNSVAAALNASGLPALRLNLEIKESILLPQHEAVTHTLVGLSSLGVGIVMDDFGSGPASLSYLWRSKFEKLKIHRHLIATLDTDPHAQQVVGSIIAMAHSLGLSVSAAGVERQEQMQLLQKLDCDEVQGYLFGRPDSLPALLANNAASKNKCSGQSAGSASSAAQS